jgi:hypothetical protein
VKYRVSEPAALVPVMEYMVDAVTTSGWPLSSPVVELNVKPFGGCGVIA